MKSYCHLCGAKYVDGATNPKLCSGCSNVSYDSSKPAVALILFDEAGRTLITKRAIEPNKGKYDIAGGFVDFNESIEDARDREAEEELNLKTGDYSEPVFVMSHIEPYPYSKENLSVVVVFFASKINRSANVVARDDVESVQFVEMNSLDKIDFSIDRYPRVIRKAHAQLFNQI